MLPSLKNPSSSTADETFFPDPSLNDVLVIPAEPDNALSSGSVLVNDEAEFPPLVASPQPKEKPPPATCSLKPSVAEEKMEGEGSQPRNSFSNSESRPNPEDVGEIQAGPMDIPGAEVEPDTEYIQALKQHDWSKVRAKKKRPDGSSGQSTTRLENCRRAGGFSASNLVSDGHWRTDSQSENLVAQSAPFPVKVTNSNSTPCSLVVDCPPNPFACLSPGLDHSLIPDEPLSSTKKPDQNPMPPGSSAGHTPFLNRASLAGKNRLELLKKFGPSKLSIPLDLNAGPNVGPASKALGSSILRTLSVSRSKNEVGGAGTRKPERLSSPSPSKNLEGCAGVSLVSPFQTWEGDQIFVSMGENGAVNEKSRVLV
ncbi:hypothetical protein NE237_005589 [Protea cynaroides]|uniref:Uncharacterized protein n=1 Tax=Protea cynaroides TaxID=273540 RepID=A0A9Q0JT92_9MAGN|nr:hypothetical protein NE237_005589 [Protea cynaroides]